VLPATTPTPAASTTPAVNARTFTEQGEAAFKSGDYKGAVYAWRHAVVDDPQNPVLLMMMSQALFATGNFEEAAGAAQAGMKMLPKDKWGVVIANHKELYGSVQDYTTQLRALETAIRDKPNNPALRFLAGYHYAYLGFPKEAVDQMNKVLKIEPRDEMAKALRDEMQPKAPQPAAPPGPQIQEPPPAGPNPEGPSAMILPLTRPSRLAA
jgi:tetratricopeptide (TPR) repeat protein